MIVNYMKPKTARLLTNVDAGVAFLRPSDSDLYMRIYNTITNAGLVMNAVVLRTGAPVALDPMMEVTVCNDVIITRKE